MKKIPLLSVLVRYYRIFGEHAGQGSLVALFCLIMAGGLTEGFGFTLAIPLLSMGDPNTQENAFTRIIRETFSSFGIELELVPLLCVIVVAFALKAVLMCAQSIAKALIATSMERDLRQKFCRKYEAMRYRYFTGTNAGHLNNLVTVEVGRALSGLNNYINLVVNLVYIVIYVSLAMTINASLTLLVLGMCALAALLLKRLTRVLEKTSLQVSRTNSEIQSLLIQFVHNFKYLKATHGSSRFLRHLFAKLEQSRVLSLKNTILPEFTASAVEPLAVVSLAALMWYYVGIQHKSMSEILVMLLFFHRAFLRIFESQNVWQRFSANIGGITVVDQAVKELDANRESDGGVTIEGIGKELRLNGVSLAYNDTPVLNAVDLVIPRNATVGIVGTSGAGKTTLFDMLSGLIMPDSGTVTIDGLDYAQVDLVSLRSLIGYVTQEPVIFDDTIANNIAFWSCNPGDPACLDRIRAAAQLAHCRSFIEESTDGYDSQIGDRGVRLSGGQRQRLAIARELFKNPPLMIFDEATSSLDSQSEAAIQQSIREMAGTRTMVVIAHRLSTIKECDVIYVLSKGRVVQSGSFEVLRADESSLFYKMCLAQQL